jgi:hypothetical protein
MGKLTRGKDGRLYNGKGTRGGLAPSKPASDTGEAKDIPSLPEASYSQSEVSVGISRNSLDLVAVKLATLKIEAPAEVSDLISDIESEASSIEFPNHNHASGEDWLSLEELIQNDNLYENNCDAVSGEIYNYLEEMSNHYPDITKIDLVQLDYTKGAHVATSLELEGESWVLDYTAKQFDSSLPVPLIAPKKDWEKLIDLYIWVKHKDTRI